MGMDGPAMTRGRTRPAGPTAEAILDAACRAIVRRGAGDVRVVDVAREAGTSTGTVHYYFETKDDVLRAALRWANDRPHERLERALLRSDGELERLGALLEFAVPYPGPPRDEYVLLIELWGRILHRPDLRPEGETISARWRGYFFDVVRSGTAAGVFRPVAEPDEVAERLIALVDGLGLKAVLGYRWTSAERMRELLYRFTAEQLGVGYAELERAGRASGVTDA